MRVLLLNDTIGSHSGSNQACSRIARRLAVAGAEVVWAGRLDGTLGDIDQRLLEAAAVALWPIAFVPAARSWAAARQKAANPRAAEEVRTALAQIRPNVVLAANVHNGLSPLALDEATRAGLPIVQYPFDNWAWCLRKYNRLEGELSPCRRCLGGSTWSSLLRGCAGRGPWAIGTWLAHGRLWGATLQRVDGWIAPSAGYENLLVARGVPRTRILRLPFPLDLDHGLQPTTTGPLVYFGTTSSCKGLDVLLAALQRSRGLEVSLYLDAPLGSRFAPSLAAAQRENQIRIETEMRWTTGVREAVCSARAVIVPSVWDSVGEQTLFEALSLGKAVVASDVPIHREWISHGHDGWLAAAGDPDAWAQQLHAAAASPADCARCGLEARARFRRGQDRWGERVLGFLNEVGDPWRASAPGAP